jgi:hypothetical protein
VPASAPAVDATSPISTSPALLLLPLLLPVLSSPAAASAETSNAVHDEYAAGGDSEAFLNIKVLHPLQCPTDPNGESCGSSSGSFASNRSIIRRQSHGATHL